MKPICGNFGKLKCGFSEFSCSIESNAETVSGKDIDARMGDRGITYQCLIALKERLTKIRSFENVLTTVILY